MPTVVFFFSVCVVCLSSHLILFHPPPQSIEGPQMFRLSLSLSLSLPEIMIASKRRRRSRRNRSSFEIFSFSSFSSFLWREGEILSLSLSLCLMLFGSSISLGGGGWGERERERFGRGDSVTTELGEFFWSFSLVKARKRQIFYFFHKKLFFLLSPCVLKNVSVWSEMAFTEEERGWIVFQYLFPSFFPLSSFSWP